MRTLVLWPCTASAHSWLIQEKINTVINQAVQQYPAPGRYLRGLTILWSALQVDGKALFAQTFTIFTLANTNPVIKAEWFALYRDDGKLDDYTRISGVRRGNFRLHPSGPAGVSLGCITLQHRTDFLAIRQALLTTPQVKLSGGLMSYGTIEVILNGNTPCPSRD